METKTYNGWTNYETWNVNLWMDNDMGSQDYFEEMAINALDASKDGLILTKSEEAKSILSDMLKEHFEDMAPKLDPGPFSDLLGAALSEVNWYEIASNLIDIAATARQEAD